MCETAIHKCQGIGLQRIFSLYDPQFKQLNQWTHLCSLLKIRLLSVRNFLILECILPSIYGLLIQIYNILQCQSGVFKYMNKHGKITFDKSDY